MSVLNWAELDRRTLGKVLPDSLVIVSLGAVEQHGEHLPTGTDSLIASTLVRAAATRASASLSTDIVLAPHLWIGASDHHLPFGGTLTLSPETLLALLNDLLASISSAGATRVVLINGHGGNSGVCHAAAAAASARHSLTVAHIDYWKVLPDDVSADIPVPGHAGAFETSMLLATSPELVRDISDRAEAPVFESRRGVDLHSAAHWSAIDGYTDHPEDATLALGTHLTEEIVNSLSAALIELVTI